jgi:hypothetical protein
MKQFVVASVLILGLAGPAFAAAKFFVTVDTVGNCSVVEGGATGLSAGKTALGEASGYASMADAEKYLAEVRKDTSKCKGVVE